MSQLSALIGKSVLNLATSCIIGRVTDVYFDEYLKNGVYFCIETSPEKTPYLLEYAEAQSIRDALVVADGVKLTSPLDVDLTALHGSLLGIPVYTPSGADKGKVTDITVAASGRVIRLQTSSNEFTPSSILSIGNVIIQRGASKSKVRSVTLPRPKKDYPVYILNDAKKALEVEKSILAGNSIPSVPALLTVPTMQTSDLPAEPAAAHAVQKTTPVTVTRVHTPLSKKEPVFSNGAFEMLLDGSKAYSYDEDARTPTRVICDYDFLLGRTLGADLTTYTGELIARQDSVVTDATVEKARKAGKLVELTLNSIKPQK